MNYIYKTKILTNSECQSLIKYYKVNECNSVKTNLNYSALPLKIEETPSVASKLKIAMGRYMTKYNVLSRLWYPWKIDNDYNFQRYDPGQSYGNGEVSGEHFEHGYSLDRCRRILGWMINLNTIYRGGGTRWPQQNYTSYARAGYCCIWPAGWTHTHHGIVAKYSEKYILTGWCSLLPAGVD